MWGGFTNCGFYLDSIVMRVIKSLSFLHLWSGLIYQHHRGDKWSNRLWLCLSPQDMADLTSSLSSIPVLHLSKVSGSISRNKRSKAESYVLQVKSFSMVPSANKISFLCRGLIQSLSTVQLFSRVVLFSIGVEADRGRADKIWNSDCQLGKE